MFPPFEAEKLTPDLENEIREFGHKFLHYPDDYCKQACRDILTLLSEIDSLRSRLADLEAKRPKWIPVEERLPDSNEMILFKIDGVGITMGFFEDGEGITHWMPLPEGPEEES